MSFALGLSFSAHSAREPVSLAIMCKNFSQHTTFIRRMSAILQSTNFRWVELYLFDVAPIFSIFLLLSLLYFATIAICLRWMHILIKLLSWCQSLYMSFSLFFTLSLSLPLSLFFFLFHSFAIYLTLPQLLSLSLSLSPSHSLYLSFTPSIFLSPYPITQNSLFAQLTPTNPFSVAIRCHNGYVFGALPHIATKFSRF